MGVSWVTLGGSESIVRYGLSENDLSMTAEGSIDTYTQAGWIGVIHRATMVQLKPATRYYYQVGADDSSG